MNKQEPLIADNAPDATNIQAVCRDCSFAVYDDQTQTGCKLNKLDKFRERGADITEAYDETGRNFFIVEDRFCVFWRENGWEELPAWGVPRDKRSDSALEARVRHDVRTKIFSVIYMDKNSSLSDLKKTANSLRSGDLRPVHTVFCNNKSDIETKDILKIAKNSGGLWGIESIAEEGASKQRCLDICLKKSKSKDHVFYSFFASGYKVPKNFHSDIDSAINDELMAFLVLDPEGDNENGEVPNGFVGQVHVHRKIGGNNQKPFVEKMKNVLESQECQHLIVPLSQIVNLP